jgi:arylsulfatase A-like enzyme
MARRNSIVLVTVDCLRADHVGFMGYPRPTTPFLDSLARESLVIPEAVVAGAPTYYSVPAILASRYPLALGRDIIGLADGEPNLALTLSQAGYATAAFAAANPYISSRFGYNLGFDRFDDFLDDHASPLSARKSIADGKGWARRLNRKIEKARPIMGPLGVIYDELYFQYCQGITPAPPSLDALRPFPAADVIISKAEQWLQSIGDRPFFVWLHLMDPHAPYYPKPEALASMGEATMSPFRARYLNSYWNRSDLGSSRLYRHRAEILSLYDAGIRWVDASLGRFVEQLRKSGRWDDCIFAVTADHGEEFLDHGGRFHPPSRLMEEIIHVPLLIRTPNLNKKQLPKSPFSMIHLAPTLLDMLQLTAPAEFQGRSYWQELRRGEDFEACAISECVIGCTNPFQRGNRIGPRVLSVRESRYKLVLEFDRRADHLYDLESDPGEQAPLAPTAQKAVRRRLLDIACEHIRHSVGARDIKARTRALLREFKLEWENPAGQSSPVALSPL